jgi:predicted Zn-dependent protease
MKIKGKILAALLALVWTLALPFPPVAISAPSMSKKEEGEMGKEATGRIRLQYSLVEDAYVVAYLDGLVKKLTASMQAKEFKINVHVLNSSMINAFAIPGGYIFLTSGVIEAMEDEEELAGVIAHEMGHSEGRHIAYRSEKASSMTWATLGTILAAIAAGAMGNADMAAAVSAFGLAGVQTKMLQFSRTDEEDADRRALKALKNADYSGWGLVRFMDTLRRRSTVPEDYPAYMMTHPVPADRSTHLASNLDNGNHSEGLARPDPDRGYFYLLKARLLAQKPDQWAIDHYSREADMAPDNFKRQLGAAIVLRGGKRHLRALEYLDRCDKLSPGSVEAIHERALVEMYSGKFQEGLTRLEGLLAKNIANDAVLRTLGWAYLETDRGEEALRVYNYLAQKGLRWSQLGYQHALALGKANREPEAHLALARYWVKIDKPLALRHYRQAIGSLPAGDTLEQAKKELEKAQSEVAEAKGKNN